MISSSLQLHYLDSFSDRNSANFLKKAWSAVGGPGSAKIESGGRLGSQCYNFDDNIPQIGPFPTVAGINPKLIGFGAAVKRSVILVTDVDFGDGWIFMARGPAPDFVQVGFVFSQDARIALTAGGGSSHLAKSSADVSLHLDTWYFIEADLTFIEPIPGHNWEVNAHVFVEGVTVMNAVGIDIGEPSTKDATPAYFLFGNVYGGRKFNRYCDFYLRVGSLAFSTAASFAGKVLPLRPSGDSFISWPSVFPVSPTTHYDKEDDTLLDLTDYIETSNVLSAGLQDRVSNINDQYPFNAIDVTLTPTSLPVKATQFAFYGDGTSEYDGGGSPGQFRVFHRIFDQEDVLDNEDDSVDKYTLAYFEDHPTSPGSVFRVSDVNGVTAGPECRFVYDSEL